VSLELSKVPPRSPGQGVITSLRLSLLSHSPVLHHDPPGNALVCLDILLFLPKFSCLFVQDCDHLTAHLPALRLQDQLIATVRSHCKLNLHARVACSYCNRLLRAGFDWPVRTIEHTSSTNSFFLHKRTTRWRLRSSARWPLLAAVRLVCSTLAPVLISFD
jgi:hypothetical protein